MTASAEPVAIREKLTPSERLQIQRRGLEKIANQIGEFFLRRELEKKGLLRKDFVSPPSRVLSLQAEQKLIEFLEGWKKTRESDSSRARGVYAFKSGFQWVGVPVFLMTTVTLSEIGFPVLGAAGFGVAIGFFSGAIAMAKIDDGLAREGGEISLMESVTAETTLKAAFWNRLESWGLDLPKAESGDSLGGENRWRWLKERLKAALAEEDVGSPFRESWWMVYQGRKILPLNFEALGVRDRELAPLQNRFGRSEKPMFEIFEVGVFPMPEAADRYLVSGKLKVYLAQGEVSQEIPFRFVSPYSEFHHSFWPQKIRDLFARPLKREFERALYKPRVLAATPNLLAMSCVAKLKRELSWTK